LNLRNHNRAENGNSSAKKRAAAYGIESRGHGMGPHLMGDYPVSESTVAADNRLLCSCTKIEVPLLAGVAVAATLGEPTHAHPISFFEAMRSRAYVNHFADYLVSWDQREDCVSPVVADHGNIGMTDPAGLNLDFNLALCQRFGGVFKGLKRGTRFHGGKGSNFLHRLKVIEGRLQARSFPLSP